MKKYLIILLIPFALIAEEKIPIRTDAYVIDNGFTNITLGSSATWMKSSGETIKMIGWHVSGLAAPTNVSQLPLWTDTTNIIFQWKESRKDARLKKAESAMVELMWDAGTLATNVFIVPAGKDDQIETFISNKASQIATNDALREKVVRYNFIKKVIERHGGEVDGSRYYP